MIALFSGIAILDTSMVHSRPAPAGKDSAVTVLAGEFRTVFANLLWIKAENYHHEYIVHNKDWTKNEDVLGLDMLITKLDPHFEEAYASGAVMMIGQNKIKEADNYLEEGVTNNPNSMMLHDEYGTFLARYMQDYKDSLFHLKRAYLLASDDWDKNRLKRLIKTVEGFSRDTKAAS
jgi:tetratricopeptide (TPR) repeat protein